MTKSMAKRIAAVQRMNPVNAGLLHAANELQRADDAERAAWAALQTALIEFHRCERALGLGAHDAVLPPRGRR